MDEKEAVFSCGERIVSRWGDLSVLGGLGKKKRVIDCGCGRGKGFPDILALEPQVFVGADLDPTCFPRDRFPSVQYVRADIRYLPFFAEFDYFFCCETLEHLSVEDNISAAVSISKTLSCGGKLLISVPGNPEVCMANPEHKQFLSPSDLVSLFSSWFSVVGTGTCCKNRARPEAFTTLMVLEKR